MTVKENNAYNQRDNSYSRRAGTIETLPFTPTRFMAVPLYAGDEIPTSAELRQSHIYLRCLTNDARLNLLKGPSPGWFLTTVRLPDRWCDGSVTIVAAAVDDDYAVGVGTPFRIGPLTWAMGGRLGALLAAILVFSLTTTSIIPIIALARYAILHQLLIVLIAPSILGCVWFLQQWYVGSVVVSAILGLISVFGPFVFFAYQSRQGRAEVDEQTLRAFLIGLSVTFLIVLVAPYLLIPIENGFWFPAYVFFPAFWSTDNLLSMMSAKSILTAGSIHPDYLGTWSLNDRGIIQAGDFIGLMTLPLVKIFVAKSIAGLYIAHLYGASIQALAIPALVVLVCRCVIANRSPLAVTLLLATTPFFLMNTFYIWPKVSGGMLVVMAFFLLEEAIRRTSVFALSAAGCSLFFAYLNHSANVVSCITIIAYCVLSVLSRHHTFGEMTRLARKGPLAMLGLAIGLAVVERLVSQVEPKSSWPILFLLTGDGDFGLDQSQVIAKVIAFYQGMTPGKFFALKGTQLMDLIWVQDDFFSKESLGLSVLATIRARQFFSLVPTIGLGMIVGLLLAFARKIRFGESRLFEVTKVDQRLFTTAMVLAASSVVTLIVFLLLFSQDMIVHQLPYGVVIALILAAALFVARSRPIFRFATCAQVAGTAVIWFFGSYYAWFHELLFQ